MNKFYGGNLKPFNFKLKDYQDMRNMVNNLYTGRIFYNAGTCIY